MKGIYTKWRYRYEWLSISANSRSKWNHLHLNIIDTNNKDGFIAFFVFEFCFIFNTYNNIERTF